MMSQQEVKQTKPQRSSISDQQMNYRLTLDLCCHGNCCAASVTVAQLHHCELSGFAILYIRLWLVDKVVCDLSKMADRLSRQNKELT